jgi:hypothetical protein
MREQVQKTAIPVRRLRLSQIRTNAGTQTRVQIDDATVADYARFRCLPEQTAASNQQ